MISVDEHYKNEKLKKLCNEFIYSKRPKYVLGRNEFAASIAQQVAIDGFIDDFTTETSWHNKPIVPIQHVPKNAIVAISVVYGRPLTAINRVKEFNLDYIDYFALKKYSNLNLLQLSYLEGFEVDFRNNLQLYENTHNLLCDAESKKQFLDILTFRLTYDLEFMKNFKNIQDQQYFESFININDNAVFVDIGGFDGCTTYTFIQKCPHYTSIYFFEPDIHNLQKAQNLLVSYPGIYYYQLGLSNKAEKLHFTNSGASSKIDHNGEITIHTDTLDNLISEPCTYIKMDVEGWEEKVIEGAQHTILNYKPQLAVCVYHKCDDLWKIPQQILSIRDDYKIYLRHYTEGITETVMYFV